MIRSEPDRLELLVETKEASKPGWTSRWISGDAALICRCLTQWFDELIVLFLPASLRLV